MTEDILSRIAAMDAQLASLQRDVARLDPAVQRVGDNVDSTRHSINNSVQVIANEVGTIRGYLGNIARDLAPVIAMAEDMKDARRQVSGGAKLAHFLWPAITFLLVFAAAGYMAFLRS